MKGGNQRTLIKPPICGKSLTNFIISLVCSVLSVSITTRPVNIDKYGHSDNGMLLSSYLATSELSPFTEDCSKYRNYDIIDI
jgi:hypothetical protein